jgi:hypothetical protein
VGPAELLGGRLDSHAALADPTIAIKVPLTVVPVGDSSVGW